MLDNRTFGYELTLIANFNNNMDLYCRVEKFYEKLKSKMLEKAQNGEHSISFFVFNFSKVEDDRYEALNFLAAFAHADGLEIESDFPSGSLVNLIW